MDIKQLLAIKLKLNAEVTTASQELTSYCAPYRGVMGLVSDECKASKQYKTLNHSYAVTFNKLRAFNKEHSKNKELQKAIHADIIQRREAKAALHTS